MRWTFQLALYERMKNDERIVLLWGDVGAALWQKHRRDFPRRVVNVGICEQATVSMAAGMAMRGLRPVVYTIMPFIIERAFEQIKLDVDQQNLPVGLVGHSSGDCGPTHQELGALPMMSLCKNIEIHWPQHKDQIPAMVAGLNIERPWFLGLHE